MATTYSARIEELRLLDPSQYRPEGDLLTGGATWDVPAHVGSVVSSEVVLPGRLHIMEIAGPLHRPLEIREADATPWVGMLYQMSGSSQSGSAYTKPYEVTGGHHNSIYDVGTTTRHLLTPDRQGQFRAIHLGLDPAFFRQLIEGNDEWLPLYEKRLRHEQSFMSLPAAVAARPVIRQLLEQLRQCPYSGVLKRMFIEGRFLDLFAEQQRQYRQVHHARASAALPHAQHELFHAIRAYLDAHYAAPPTLLELARLFGINDFKLKKGFKEVCGTTVFGYIAEKRLTEARALLETTALPVQEVGEQVGFVNAAHFATCFRRKFGLAPSQVR
ncbi:helix-turn-helix transcriptional regulator [Hymenobacter busanensis]|uniref:Helix-turn-helix transcriptional regulator n=1 Tax=Hymenobacter busanensis TaxID=2607656 RepID=A0A7L5A174_9BACT|nr:AraC family transcriptional regulator [Hymenobacter busanensis]KAA9338618.1 helix-turn-helix transcriptional regulator [Hymenobacter busanensis]QHJ08953.1 helix-turn-helix domain-containing protein [Hymenobacter busanensis]